MAKTKAEQRATFPKKTRASIDEDFKQIFRRREDYEGAQRLASTVEDELDLQDLLTAILDELLHLRDDIKELRGTETTKEQNDRTTASLLSG